MELSEFLEARIGEDEEVARAVIEHPAPADADSVYVRWSRYDTGWVPAASGEWAEGSALFARWDPARVLAECEAKRRIITDLYPDLDKDNDALNYEFGGTSADPEDLLRLLALPFADHPDYKQGWAL